MSLANFPKRVLFDMSEINQYQYVDLAPFNAIYVGTDDSNEPNTSVFVTKYGNDNATDDNHNQEVLLFDCGFYSPFAMMMEKGYLSKDVLCGFEDENLDDLYTLCGDKIVRVLVDFIRKPSSTDDELILTTEWLLKSVINPSINQIREKMNKGDL